MIIFEEAMITPANMHEESMKLAHTMGCVLSSVNSLPVNTNAKAANTYSILRRNIKYSMHTMTPPNIIGNATVTATMFLDSWS